MIGMVFKFSSDWFSLNPWTARGEVLPMFSVRRKTIAGVNGTQVSIWALCVIFLWDEVK